MAIMSIRTHNERGEGMLNTVEDFARSLFAIRDAHPSFAQDANHVKGTEQED